MSYIYKITNLVNNKIYIGYTSRNLKRRFYEHCWSASQDKDKNILHKAINKYGKNNFKIEEVLSFNENEKNWEELERYYINYFNAYVPNGYNVAEGGNKPPVKRGDSNNKTIFPDREMPILLNLLKDTSISYEKISEITGLSICQLYNINMGKSRKQEGIIYPIRKFSIYEERALKIIEILANDKTISNEEISKKFKINKNSVASINSGKLFNYLWDGDYPIRKVKVPNDYKEKQKMVEKVLKIIKENPKISKAQIQSISGYGRFVVDKIIKGDYPYQMDNIKYPLL